jgi:hypothetical protein
MQIALLTAAGAALLAAVAVVVLLARRPHRTPAAEREHSLTAASTVR